MFNSSSDERCLLIESIDRLDSDRQALRFKCVNDEAKVVFMHSDLITSSVVFLGSASFLSRMRLSTLPNKLIKSDSDRGYRV